MTTPDVWGLLEEAFGELQWCSGSPDFCPLLEKLHAALAMREQYVLVPVWAVRAISDADG
jgi:hypothetical protein